MAVGRKFLKGTLDMLILKALSWGPAHGYAVAKWIEERTGDALRIEEGSLYPALRRMEERGWVDAEWRVSDSGRRARFYELTTAGRRQLREDVSEWAGFVAAVAAVLGDAEAPAWAGA